MDYGNKGIVAREGWPFIICSTLIAVLLVAATVRYGSAALAIPGGIAVILAIFVISFFRNPERRPPADPTAVIAPADGTVIVAERVSDTPLGTEALKISIFMSVFNVHVNRAPFDGTVVDVTYQRGKFLDARDGKASSENERNGVIIETPGGVRIAFVQIAGLIARRIICYARVGDRLVRGNRYGLIRFGSRVDIYLPADMQPLVKLGDTTVAGQTVLGRLA